MANCGSTERGQSVVTRWRLLAERRLNYLIELYESGRWKLYYKEPDFLKAIQEARAALKTWEQLSPPDPAQDKPVEVAIEQAENSGVPASPFTDMAAANPALADSVQAKNDLGQA